MSQQQYEANWYPDPQNPAQLRYFDGAQWTQNTQPAAPPQQSQASAADDVSNDSNRPMYTFTSHISGKNAKVTIYHDRIEWEQPRGVSAGKITAGFMTGGLSLLATGVKSGKAGSEMIPVKSISSVTTRRDGMLNTIVSVICSGNTIDFRTSHNEAAQAKSVITQLILNPASPPHAAAPTAPVVIQMSTPAPIPSAQPVQSTADPMEQLTKLKSLLDAGVLTQEEFDAQKTRLLGQL